MFNHPTSRPHASAYASDPYAFSPQPWARFDLNQAVSSSVDPSHSHHAALESFNSSSGMDWTPTSSEVPSGYHHDGHGGNDVELNSLSPVQTGGGVGRLVAHFENKGFVPFENKGYAPPLPPRPAHGAQTQQSIPRAQFDNLGYFGNGPGLASSFNPNRIVTPAQSPGETHWGVFGLQSRMTSPVATNSFGLQDASRGSNSGAGQLTGQFGVLDDFVSGNRVQSSAGPSLSLSQGASSPMVSPSAVVSPAQPSPPTSGTPGFEIWRPPGSVSVKSEAPQSTSSALPAGNYGKPPVPNRPKPNVNASGNQFILEFNPSAKVKGKAPAKPPRLRAPQPSVPPPFSPEIKQEPATPHASQLSPSITALPVPAEAWEQFKSTIRALYLDERRPLKEVMNVMAEKYNFQATPKMYKTRFSQWGFVKNNTEDEVKRLLSMKFQRDAEGKVSEFVRNGRVVNLGTYLKRKGVTEYDLIDFELPADLPAHVKCRTPTPPPAPEYLRSPDLVRAQELVVGNMRKAFLHCRQVEVETDTQVGWSTTMVWGAGSSDLLMEANFYFEARDADQGGHFLMRAFKQLEVDLRKLSPVGINELLLGMVQRDPGMMTALCKYLAAYSTTNLERSHPLRQIFTCLYEVQQKHGPGTLSDLLWGSIPTIAEELEAIYSRRHPYVARAWIDLALFYNHIHPERLGKLVDELRDQERQLEQRHGANSVEVLSLRYSILQLLYAAGPQSEPTKQAAVELWNHVRGLGVVFSVRDAKPNVYCYHSLLKVDPWTKRCRRRYDSGVAIMEEHVGVKVLPYFEEDFHTTVHAPDSQEAWSAALDHMQAAKWAYI
ncbi:clr5 domain-containing protein [Hirsutella rhossiliensis]|uniref:Clr5 domain-containing protein n=1 Tax=Hirsutella rhossiliensis TaxID=111463 RepID=A0A9P8MTW1_9HYPO|nr:clr5 domain-containing protein [Hirsutella rhossiliensis]KAH0961180.1 clr5 domain-containing protein [Hirsutella rhossiliensis]